MNKKGPGLSVNIKETGRKDTISLVPSLVQPQQEQVSLIKERNAETGKKMDIREGVGHPTITPVFFYLTVLFIL